MLGLKAVNCQSGDPWPRSRSRGLQGESARRPGRGGVQAARQLGESLATVQKFDVPLARRHHIFPRSSQSIQPRQKGGMRKASRSPALLSARHRARSEFRHGLLGGGHRLHQYRRARPRQRILTPRHSSCANTPASGKSSPSPPHTIVMSPENWIKRPRHIRSTSRATRVISERTAIWAPYTPNTGSMKKLWRYGKPCASNPII